MSTPIPKKSVLLASLAVGLACGTVFASTGHDSIVLRDKDKNAIMTTTANNAFSMQGTCGYCHGDKATYPALLSYEEIERHSYHAQLGANELRGFNPYNADSTDAFRTGAAAPGKSWVQSPGHVGSW